MSPHEHVCITVLRKPARAGQLWRCYCGQGWQVTTANDVFTDGSTLIWRRLSRWNLLAHHRLTRQARATG